MEALATVSTARIRTAAVALISDAMSTQSAGARVRRVAASLATQTLSGLLVLLIAAAVLALASRVSDAVTGGALIRFLGGVAASDLGELPADRSGPLDSGGAHAVTLVAKTSLGASSDTPYEGTVCIGPGHYFLTVRGIRAADGRYLGRARLTREPPGAVVDQRVNPQVPVSWSFLTASEAACYRLFATAPARLYWLFDW